MHCLKRKKDSRGEIEKKHRLKSLIRDETQISALGPMKKWSGRLCSQHRVERNMSANITLLFFIIHFVLLVFIPWIPMRVYMFSLEQHRLSFPCRGGDRSLLRLTCQHSTANWWQLPFTTCGIWHLPLEASSKSQDCILLSEHRFMSLTQFDERVRHLCKASSDPSRALYHRE